MQPANIMIDSEGNGVLIDLGSAEKANLKINNYREVRASRRRRKGHMVGWAQCDHARGVERRAQRQALSYQELWARTVTGTPSAPVSRARCRAERSRGVGRLRLLSLVTAPFRPPELFQVSSDALLDVRTDVFSLGCTLYTMLYRTYPFDGSATAALSGRYQLPDTPSYPAALKTLMAEMLAVDLAARPWLKTVIQRLQALL